MQYPFHVDAPAVADAGEELAIQTRLLGRLKIIAPSIRCAAVPNGGKRTAWAAMKAKREGMSSGFPDLICTWHGGLAFLEMKARTTPLDGEQIRWLNFLHAGGHACGVFRSVDTAVAFLRRQNAPFLDLAA